CDCRDEGVVLLFYNYCRLSDPLAVATELDHYILDQLSGIRGKIRIAPEGYNITVAGSRLDMCRMVEYFVQHPDLLPGLELLTDAAPQVSSVCLTRPEPDSALFHRFVYSYFKPSRGCVHAFDRLSIKVLDRLFDGIDAHYLDIPCSSRQAILQLVTDCQPPGRDSTRDAPLVQRVVHLPPAQFHQHLVENQSNPDVVVLDTRNYYESEIGKFKGAVAPPLRKYSTFPKYLEGHQELFQNKTVYSYCTGGVRCETGAPLVAQMTRADTVYQLQGGIHNYLSWADANGVASLFDGVNYVFDARQSLSLADPAILSKCVVCKRASVHLAKCQCLSII
ncbi:thiosulfate sulfurtransferase (rhodanese)-like domain-containing protein 2, partial [Kappamyces sp. JEL0680]